MDHLFTLNEDTPKLKCSGRKGISPSLVFGVDSKLFLKPLTDSLNERHHDEVDTMSIFRGVPLPDHDHGDHNHNHNHDDAPLANPEPTAELPPLTRSLLEDALAILSKDSVYRVKGFVTFDNCDRYVLNWAFGRFDLTPFTASTPEDEGEGETGVLRLTMMGERGEMKRWARKFAERVGALIS